MMRRLSRTTSAAVVASAASSSTTITSSTRAFHPAFFHGGGGEGPWGASNPMQQRRQQMQRQQQQQQRREQAAAQQQSQDPMAEFFNQFTQQAAPQQAQQQQPPQMQRTRATPDGATRTSANPASGLHDFFQFLSQDAVPLNRNAASAASARPSRRPAAPRDTAANSASTNTASHQQQQPQQAATPQNQQGQQGQGPMEFPFGKLFESMFDGQSGATGPFHGANSTGVTIQESTNHATATIDVPRGLKATNPKVQQLKNGGLMVTADLSLPANSEEHAQAQDQAQPIKEFLSQLGLNFDVQHSGVGLGKFPPLRRSFNVNPQEYCVEDARAYTDDGQLMVYIPKRKVQAVSPSSSSYSSSSAPQQANSSAASRQTANPTSASTTSSRTSAASEQQAAPRAYAAPAEPTAEVPVVPQESQAPAAAAPAPEWKPRTHVQWPPTVTTVEDGALNLIYNVNLPADVKPESIDLSYDADKNRLTATIEHIHTVSTTVSEEKQHFQFTRHLELPDLTNCTQQQVEKMVGSIESHYNAEDATLAIVIEKPQPIKPVVPATSGSKIPIKINAKKQ